MTKTDTNMQYENEQAKNAQGNAAPLCGVTVVENARSVAGQYAGRLLAAMGARVLKLEPEGGLAMRRAAPLAGEPAANALFEYLNLGKHSITCDASDPAHEAKLRALLARADVFIDDTRVEARRGLLAPDAMHDAFADIVYVSVLPFGAFGEKSGYRASEINLQHAGGEGFLMPNGLALERFPDRPPVKIGGHFAEYVGGMSAVTATLASLYTRDAAGGQFVDVSVQDANISIGCFAVQRLGDGVMETRHTRSFKYGGVLECEDGYVELLVLEQHQWEKLVEVMDRPEWALADELRDPLERGRRGAEINRHIRAWAKTQRVKDVVDKAQAAGVPMARYNDPVDVLHSDAFTQRGNFELAEFASGRKLPVFVAPYKFPQSPLHAGRAIGSPGSGEAAVPGDPAVSARVSPVPKGGREKAIHEKATHAPPLKGLRIADFTLHAAGPYCTQMLSLLGAECIKVETNARLDIFRKPHPVYGRMEAATFDQVASGKMSVRLNLKTQRGVELAHRLVAASDVVAESFRPGVMKRLGLDYDTLRAINPRMVMVSVSAAGQTGPDAGHAGYAPLFSAAGGLGSLTGYDDGPPVEIRHVMDHSTGLAASNAVVAACLAQKWTGRGAQVDVAAREVAMSFIGDVLLEQAMGAAARTRQGNDMPMSAPHNVYRCSGNDEWVSIAVATDSEWLGLLTAIGEPQWASDARFATQSLRWVNRAELDALLSRWTATRTAHEVTRLLQARGVPAFPSSTSRDIASDAHLRERGTILDAQGPQGVSRTVVGAPWRFGKTPAVGGRWTPGLGEHEQYVYGELLGIGKSELSQLIEDKVIW